MTHQNWHPLPFDILRLFRLGPVDLDQLGSSNEESSEFLPWLTERQREPHIRDATFIVL